MNGSSDIGQPTETTSLISRNGSSPTVLPSVDQYVEVVRSLALSTSTIASNTWLPETLEDEIVKLAFSFIVLLTVGDTLQTYTRSSQDALGEWVDESRMLSAFRGVNEELIQVWEQCLAIADSDVIEEIMWFPYPTANSSSYIRVVDLLYTLHVPEQISTHRVLELSMQKVWTRGRSTPSDSSTGSERLWIWLKNQCTPRALHLLDLLYQSIYLGALVYYAIIPPTGLTEPTQTKPQFREYILLVYSFAQLTRIKNITFSTIPFLLTFLALLSCLPSVPYPQDYAYDVILLALSLDVLRLHLPFAPSPLFLLPPSNALPLSVLIWHGCSKIFFPVLVFFLPATLLAFFLLSTSLSGILLQTATTQIVSFDAMNPSPLEARTAFLLLLAVLVILLICSLLMLVLVYPAINSSNHHHHTIQHWDRYSWSIGLEARQRFIQAVVKYGTPYVFPPPFNLLQLFTQIPIWIFNKLGKQSLASNIRTFEMWLWLVVVMPMSVLISSVWAWGTFLT
ncbi:hypothetical protein C8Q75DRAFT_750195 [Abortiporus biennis]|nr:hypothetical protein C8Q75DRAFT_750195 [Abortiporus biennis]